MWSQKRTKDAEGDEGLIPDQRKDTQLNDLIIRKQGREAGCPLLGSPRITLLQANSGLREK